MAKKAKNADRFNLLWEGKYRSILDGDKQRYPSQSEADAALCTLLAFWTGKDTERIDKFFRMSRLMRPKWDEKHYADGRTYGEAMIQRAVENCHGAYIPSGFIFRMSDIGNAERLIANFGERLLYVNKLRKWFIYDGSRWGLDQRREIESLAKETIRHIPDELEGIEENTRGQLLNWAKKSEDNFRVKAMIDRSEAEEKIAILPEVLDPDHTDWLFNVANGTIDLRTGQLLLHNRLHMITKIAPVHHDPAAGAPRWTQFLYRIFDRDNDLITYVQRVVGYTMIGGIRERVLFILWGDGRNGKTIFREMIMLLMGDYGMSTPVGTLMERRGDAIPNDIARLKGVRYVSASESEAESIISPNMVKLITGGDTLSARYLYGEWFDFRPKFKCWLTTNHKPQIPGGGDQALWDRIKLIPFDVRIPENEVIPTEVLLSILCAELPGILNWTIQGCLDYQKHGLVDPERVRDAIFDYREEEDVLADFIGERCIKNKDMEVSRAQLYQTYYEWCMNRKVKAFGQVRFARAIAVKGYTTRKSNGQRIWMGLGLITVPVNDVY